MQYCILYKTTAPCLQTFLHRRTDQVFMVATVEFYHTSALRVRHTYILMNVCNRHKYIIYLTFQCCAVISNLIYKIILLSQQIFPTLFSTVPNCHISTCIGVFNRFVSQGPGGKGGIRTHALAGLTGFADRGLKPNLATLPYLSKSKSNYMPNFSWFINFKISISTGIIFKKLSIFFITNATNTFIVRL